MLWYDCGNGWQRAHMARKELHLDAILCCPGPSLKNTPDLRGRGRKVFALNTAYPTVTPDIWIGMDEPHCYDINLLTEGFPKIFRGPYAKREYFGQKLHTYPESYFADVDTLSNGKTMFDLRSHDVKFAWYKHSLGVALHFMVWMGARDIFLVGCDLGGSDDYCHGLKLSDDHRKINRRLYAQQVVFIEMIAEQAKRYGVTIHSSTPDSPINKFLPYTSVDQLLEKHKPKPVALRHVLDRPVTPVTVLRSGGEYKPEHVWRLAQRIPNLTCFSDTPVPGVRCIPLKHDWPGWWAKMELFGPGLDTDILYFDLDTTIVGDITPLFKVGQTTLLSDFYYPDVLQSALMYIKQSDKARVYEEFMKDPSGIMGKYTKPPLHGDQGFLNAVLTNPQRWQKVLPDHIVSYKVHCKKGVPKGASVVCFHGKPRPWDLDSELTYDCP